jgi:hypothetical protein
VVFGSSWGAVAEKQVSAPCVVKLRWLRGERAEGVRGCSQSEDDLRHGGRRWRVGCRCTRWDTANVCE